VCDVIELQCTKAGGGRPPVSLERMPRMCFAQLRSTLSPRCARIETGLLAPNMAADSFSPGSNKFRGSGIYFTRNRTDFAPSGTHSIWSETSSIRREVSSTRSGVDCIHCGTRSTLSEVSSTRSEVSSTRSEVSSTRSEVHSTRSATSFTADGTRSTRSRTDWVQHGIDGLRMKSPDACRGRTARHHQTGATKITVPPAAAR
jgi:hypothetical protein